MLKILTRIQPDVLGMVCPMDAFLIHRARRGAARQHHGDGTSREGGDDGSCPGACGCAGGMLGSSHGASCLELIALPFVAQNAATARGEQQEQDEGASEFHGVQKT